MYDEIAASYNELHGAEQQRKLEKLLAHVDLSDVETVADIGCGTAHLHSYFENKNYFGIDPSQGLINQAPRDVHVLCCAGENIPIEDGSFDLVLSLTALHNYNDWEKGIEELWRITQKTLIVGVLKKAPTHDQIISLLKTLSITITILKDQHDTLMIIRKS